MHGALTEAHESTGAWFCVS